MANMIETFSLRVAQREIARAKAQGRRPVEFYLAVVKHREERARFARGAVEQAKRDRRIRRAVLDCRP